MEIRIEDITEYLKKGRTNIAEIGNLAAVLESDSDAVMIVKDAFGPLKSKSVYKYYIKALIDQIMAEPCDYSWMRGLSVSVIKEMMYMCYGVHEEFPPEKYASIQERRVDFAKKYPTLFIKNSADTDSIGRNVRDRENLAIETILVEGIKARLKNGGHFYGLLYNACQSVRYDEGEEAFLHWSNAFEQLKTEGAYEECIEEDYYCRPFDTLDYLESRGMEFAKRFEEILIFKREELPTWYLKLSGLKDEDYNCLRAEEVRKSITEKYPFTKVVGKNLTATLREETTRAYEQLIRVLVNDPVLSYYIIRTLCFVEENPLLDILNKECCYPDTPVILTGQGNTLYETHKWMREYLDFMDEELQEGTLEDWQKFVYQKGPIREKFVDFKREIEAFFREMEFRGEVFAKPNRYYRVSPKLLNASYGTEALIEITSRRTNDWLMLSYYNQDEKNAFNLGFQVERLIFGLFSPFSMIPRRKDNEQIS